MRGITLIEKSVETGHDTLPLIALSLLYALSNGVQHGLVRCGKNSAEETGFVFEMVMQRTGCHPGPFHNSFGRRVAIPPLGKQLMGGGYQGGLCLLGSFGIRAARALCF